MREMLSWERFFGLPTTVGSELLPVTPTVDVLVVT